MQQFEAEEAVALQTTGEQKDMVFPARAEGRYSSPTSPWPRTPRSWKQVSPEWDGSKWSTPTMRTLGGPEYDTDQEWQLRSMRYGDGWAYDSL